MLQLFFNKKFLSIVALAAVLALAGCGASSSNQQSNQGAQETQQQETQQQEQQQSTEQTQEGASGDGGGTAVAFDEAKAQETYKASCAGCHGANLEGGFGSNLQNVGSRMDADAIYDVIKNGRGQMPPQGQVSDEDARNVAAWLASLK